MKKSLKAVFLVTALALMSSSATAKYVNDEAVKRKEIIAAHQNNPDNIIIGLMPGFGKFEDANKLIAKYMPLMNYLSLATGVNVSFAPERDTAIIKKMLRAQKYKWFYANAEMSVVANEMGYHPVAVNNSRIDSVVFVPADSKILSWRDLSGKRVGSIPNTMVNSIAQAKFTEIGMKEVMESVDVNVLGQDIMFKFLDDKKVDAIIVRGKTAEGVIKKNPGKYRIALKSGSVPGYVFMVHPSVPEEEINKVRNALVALTFDNPNHVNILKNFGAEESSREAVFTVITSRDLLDMRRVLKIIEPDFVKTE